MQFAMKQRVLQTYYRCFLNLPIQNNCRKDHSHGPCRKSKSAEHLEQREHSRSHTPLTQEHEAPPDDVTLADAVAADVAATDF